MEQTLSARLHRLFDTSGREVRRSEFPTGGSYTSAVREGSLELRGDRVTRLGTNMWVKVSTRVSSRSKHER